MSPALLLAAKVGVVIAAAFIVGLAVFAILRDVNREDTVSPATLRRLREPEE